MQSLNELRICYTGGGTLGSVSPLLAVQEKCKAEQAIWIGTQEGPERSFVESSHIRFFGLHAFRLRRFFSLKTFLEIPNFFRAIKQAKHILQEFKPNILVCAGSFIQVPVGYAAHTLSIPTVLLQLDVQPGLANTMLARYASVICTPFQEQQNWKTNAVVRCGIPVSQKIIRKSLKKNEPTILILGGGTGSEWLNTFVQSQYSSLLSFAHVLHCQGIASRSKRISTTSTKMNYTSFSIVDTETLARLYAEADVVVCRAGMGTLAEVAALQKPTIVVPMPSTHQELNAKYFEDKKSVVVFHQVDGYEKLTERVKKLLVSTEEQEVLKKNIVDIFPKNAVATLINLIRQYAR